MVLPTTPGSAESRCCQNFQLMTAVAGSAGGSVPPSVSQTPNVVKYSLGHLVRLHAFGQVARLKGHRVEAERRKTSEHVLLRAFEILEDKDRHRARAVIRLQGLEVNQPIAIRIGQRIEQGSLDDGDAGGRSTGTKGQRHREGDGVQGVFAKQAPGSHHAVTSSNGDATTPAEIRREWTVGRTA